METQPKVVLNREELTKLNSEVSIYDSMVKDLPDRENNVIILRYSEFFSFARPHFLSYHTQLMRFRREYAAKDSRGVITPDLRDASGSPVTYQMTADGANEMEEAFPNWLQGGEFNIEALVGNFVTKLSDFPKEVNVNKLKQLKSLKGILWED